MHAIARVAKGCLGFEELRPGQADAVRAVLDGKDTLVVMATGAGKSAIYQLAGWLIDGATLVISPLISLQRDQIENIEEEQPGEAAAIDASVSETKREERLEELADEELEFLFLAPEQLAREETVEQLARASVSLLVVDEAYCISQWGHDFRPDYMRIGPLGRTARLADRACAHGHRVTAGARGDSRPPPDARAGGDHPRLRPPQHPAGGGAPSRRAPEAAGARRACQGARRPGDRLRGDA